MKTFAAATPVPPSTASSSTGPVPAATPDADWMNDLEDITIEWGDMDKEQLDNLKTNQSARLALAAPWQQPSKKKVRKHDPLTKDYTPVDTYNVTQQGSHQPTDLGKGKNYNDFSKGKHDSKGKNDKGKNDKGRDQGELLLLFTMILTIIALDARAREWAPVGFPDFA